MPDLTHVIAQYASIEPWLRTVTPAPERERLEKSGRAEQAGGPDSAVRRAVPATGGMATASSGPRSCSTHTAGSWTAATRRDRRAARPARGPVPALSLPHHHELRQGLPEGPQPRQGHRADQADDGRAADVTARLSVRQRSPRCQGLRILRTRGEPKRRGHRASSMRARDVPV